MHKTIDIFIGGSIDRTISESYVLFAQRLGTLINQRCDYHIIFDGCDGLPAIVFEILDNSGKAIICYSTYYRAKYTNLSPFVDSRIFQLLEVDKQSEMTDMVLRMADALIFMKGKLGTYEELFRAINSKKNKEHDKPIVIININHEADDLVSFLSSCGVSEYYYVTDNVIDCLNFIEGELYRESSSFYNNYVKYNYVGRDYPLLEESNREFR